MPPPPPFGAPPPGYGSPFGSPYGFVAAKPPRPNVAVGSWLLIVGSAVLIVGAFTPWLRVEGFGENATANAFTRLTNGRAPAGSALVFFGVVTAGLGIAMVAAKRVLSVAIIAVVFAAFNVLVAIVHVSKVRDQKALFDLFSAETTWGVGPFLAVGGGLIALGGAIATLSKPRR